MLSSPPKLGPPASWFRGVWVDAPDGEPLVWYDELDAERHSIRCVREFRDGSLKAYSYDALNWRDHMPEGPLPSLGEIRTNPEFLAGEIACEDFEALWLKATQARNVE